MGRISKKTIKLATCKDVGRNEMGKDMKELHTNYS